MTAILTGRESLRIVGAPLYNKLNSTPADSVFSSESGLGYFTARPFHIPSLANLCRLLICELGARIVLALAAKASAFILPVLGIIGVSPEHKMGRIYTRRVVAFVHNDNPGWNCPVHDHPGDAVSLFDDAPIESYVAVSLFVLAASPHPAILFSADSLPKSQKLARGEFERFSLVCDYLSSFIHKLILYVEVRVRNAVNAATALAFYPINKARSQAS